MYWMAKLLTMSANMMGRHFWRQSPGVVAALCLVVVKFGKAVLEEFVGKDVCLGEIVHATAHFKVDPGVAGNLVELVLVDEFLGDVCKFDADVLWPVKRGVQIEVFEVHGGKPGITLGENTIDKQFDKFN